MVQCTRTGALVVGCRVVVLVLVLVLKESLRTNLSVQVLGAQVLVLVLEEKSLVVSLFLVFFSWHLQSRFTVFCETCFQTHNTLYI